MEVLKPELFWINGRCYRKNNAKNDYGIRRDHNDDSSSYDNGPQQQSGSGSGGSGIIPPYVEPEEYGDDDEGEAVDYEIEEDRNFGFKTRCTNIPSTLFAAVIGTKGATKKRLEAETKTQIVIPRMNEKGNIVIKGEIRQNVIKARKRVDFLTSQARFKRDPTHFTCFPLNSPSVIQNVREFKEKVLQDFKGPSYGIDSSVFQEPEKIHLTINVLTLLEANERTKAASLLEESKCTIKEIASEGNLRIRVQGLEIMNDDPTEVDVLYAKCHFQDDVVQTLADFISNIFQNSDFAKGSRTPSVKIHATLMNTRLRAEGETPREGGGGGKAIGRQSINAKPLLEKYGAYDFGFVEIKEVHISTRFTKGSDGFYKPFAKISLLT